MRDVKRRKMAANANEHGEGAGAEACADSILKTIESLRLGRIEPDVALKRLEAEFKLIHEVEGRPQERVEHSGTSTREVHVHEPSGPKPPPPKEKQ